MITRKPEQLFQAAEEAAAPVSSNGRESHEVRLSRVLKVATTVIAKEGYQRATMRTVAKTAGVSLAGLYHYFKSKEEMLFLIQFRTFSALVSNLREKLHGVKDPDKQLEVMIRAHVGYFAANMAALKVCSHELDLLTGEVYRNIRAIRHEYYSLAHDIIRRILETRSDAGCDRSHKSRPDAVGEGMVETPPHAGEKILEARCVGGERVVEAGGQTRTGGTGERPLDVRVATMSLFGTLNWLYRWYDPKTGPSPTTLARQITEQLLNGTIGRNLTGATKM